MKKILSEKSSLIEDYPVSKRSFDDLNNSFKLSYTRPYSCNGDILIDINTNIKSDIKLKVPVDIIITHALLDLPLTESEGIAAYYILRQNDNSELYFTYAITPASYNEGIVTPTPQPNGQVEYLVPTYNGYEKINQALFESYQVLYFQSIEIREFTGNKTYRIKDFEAKYGKKHPTNTFYSENEFYYFHENNKEIAVDTTLFYLTFNHGATYIKDPYSGSFKVQTPVLIFEYDNVLQINNMKLSPGEPYKAKALDVGRLCPPDC
ncbi:MAG: hypothetical protein F9K23_07190 [Bacteroidetes bacterium]|nr:MAG: hypothetical protein F9K23_07190 [Bacteroidota bacterium]